MERVLRQSGESATPQRTVQTKFTSLSRENELAKDIDNSPMMVAQGKRLESLFGSAIQRQGTEEEEPLQGKFRTVQRVGEEEEPLQGKFEAAQRVEDEEPLQGKLLTIQRAEEEETLQGKFESTQRVEEEEPTQGKFAAVFPAQRKDGSAVKLNDTGLPDSLKSGIESLSGMSMESVRVHYNSSQPAQLNAHAYTQGTDIHVAPGQERHLPHEAWHVVQQAQGRVKPTIQMKDGVPVNNDAGLEHEADVMGAKAVSQQRSKSMKPISAMPELSNNTNSSVQLKTLKIDKQFQNTPTARDAGKLGLGEKLKLTSSDTGPQKEGETTGAAVYKKESGSGTLTTDTYDANETPGTVEFSVKRVGEDDALKDKLSLQVIKPDQAQFESYSAAHDDYGSDAGAGFTGASTIYGPSTVSFNGLEFREGAVNSTATGAFDKWNARAHPEGTPVSVDEKNKEATDDDIQSGAITKSVFESKGAGYFLWAIPWQYRVPGKSWGLVATVNHRADINADATVTMSKLNGNDTRAVPDSPWAKK